MIKMQYLKIILQCLIKISEIKTLFFTDLRRVMPEKFCFA